VRIVYILLGYKEWLIDKVPRGKSAHGEELKVLLFLDPFYGSVERNIDILVREYPHHHAFHPRLTSLIFSK